MGVRSDEAVLITGAYGAGKSTVADIEMRLATDVTTERQEELREAAADSDLARLGVNPGAA